LDIHSFEQVSYMDRYHLGFVAMFDAMKDGERYT
jgi:hypothetical protein